MPDGSAKRINALVLQGGGALGSYQAGVYEALDQAKQLPQWVAGISIGAINAALIAGNPPEERVAKMRTFWTQVSSQLAAPAPASDGPMRTIYNETAAMIAAMQGVPGFFSPRWPPTPFNTPGSSAAISLYDTTPLRATLLNLVDFDRINRGDVRLSVGAVHVTTGNFVYFDNTKHVITPEHIMASGALPPGFGPVLVDGEAYWDGGLVSNTPLQYVLDLFDEGDITIYQVDLFSARGPLPQTLPDVAQREKDIRYSSRTRFNTDMMRERIRLREAARRLVAKLPAEMKDDPDARTLSRINRCGHIAVMHLINRHRTYQSQSKDYEFSRSTMTDHWVAGLDDTRRSLASPGWVKRKVNGTGLTTFDLADEHN